MSAARPTAFDITFKDACGGIFLIPSFRRGGR
jgi:hypothetical protein